jgi:hypothetical protein
MSIPAIVASAPPICPVDPAKMHAAPPPSAFSCSARKLMNKMERRAKRLMVAIVYRFWERGSSD